MEPSKTQVGKIRSGLTFVSMMAILYAIVVFIPATGYLDLMLGGATLPISWFVLILWVELGRLFGHRISKQEATMVFALLGTAVFVPNYLIYRVFFRDSPIVQFFGIANELPSWWVPPQETGIGTIRTIFHPSWAVPIFLTVADQLLWAVAFWSLALLGRKLFMEVEQLPFPIEQMNATAILTISESRKEEDLHILYASATLGFIYGFILYAYPFIMQAWAGVALSIIPIPWFDLSPQLTQVLPGVILGVATDLIPIATALILPVNVVIGILIGSFAVYFFGNLISVRYGIFLQPWWSPGMTLSLSIQRSVMFLWASIIIGIGVGAGLGPLLRHLPVLLKGSDIKASGRLEETFSLKRWVLIPLVLETVASIAFYLVLAPEFPIWYIIPFLIGFPLLLTLTDGRMLGTTGVTYAAQANNALRLTYWATGYQRADVWFVPWPWLTGIGPQLSQLKVCQLTDTSARSLIKAFWIFLPIAMIFGFMFVEIFWSIAPIPSARYPGASVIWPINVTYDSLWIRGRQLGLFRLDWLLMSLALGIALHFVLDFAHSPVSFISIAAGTVTYTPYAVTYLIGLIIRFVFWRIAGRDFFESKSKLIAAGLMMGEVIAIAAGIAITLIVTSIWTLPF